MLVGGLYNYTAPSLVLRTHLSDTRHCTAQLPSLQRQHKYNYNARKYRYNAWKYNYNAGKYKYDAGKYRYNAGKYKYDAGKYRHNAEKFKYNTGKKIWLQLGLVKKVALDLTYILSS